jgi:hypothetical protein
MIWESNTESILMYRMDSTGSGQGEIAGFWEYYNVHFHENKPHPSDLLSTITEKDAW